MGFTSFGLASSATRSLQSWIQINVPLDILYHLLGSLTQEPRCFADPCTLSSKPQQSTKTQNRPLHTLNRPQTLNHPLFPTQVTQPLCLKTWFGELLRTFPIIKNPFVGPPLSPDKHCMYFYRAQGAPVFFFRKS